MSNNFEYEILSQFSDDDGNLQTLDLKISNEITVKLINIYAPNEDSPSFFNNINNIIEQSTADYEIICGDFNLVMNPEMDCDNYNKINNPRARETLLQMMKSHNLVDSFRLLHPKISRYTWRRRNPLKQARLDHFIVSSPLMDIIEDCTINSGYRTDHSIVKLRLRIDRFIRGKGVWKFNCSLLKNENYLNLINRAIQEEIENYALPV